MKVGFSLFVKQKLLYISGMETERNMDVKAWAQQVIKPAEIEKYLINGKDFIDEESIFGYL